MSNLPRPEALFANIDYNPPKADWMDVPAVIKPGRYCYAANPDSLNYVGLPHARKWNPLEEDWKLPENWQEIIFNGLRERLQKYRSFKIFMDICVRCGACADKCHFFIGSGDPKNMPVLRAELLRSVYRGEFTTFGKILGRFVGGRKLTAEVIKEWWYYFFQCSECRRCSVFCPYGIDTAEVTIIGRELLNLLGLNIDWIATPVANCYRTGNHLGIQPHAFYDMIDFFCDDIEDITGIRPEPTFNRKGADILFVTPSGDVFADPGTYTCMGYLLLFEFLKREYGLDVTWSTYASEGGNFGFFTSHETMKRLNSKMYMEADRLGAKWIIGGECGHMWRVVHQYMDTLNGPDFQGSHMQTPVNPITGTVFQNAASTKMIHIAEFTADLIKHGKLNLNKKRNAGIHLTWHDSCNVSRGMGMLEEPRFIIKNIVEEFTEMPAGTIRAETFCCGGGSGLNAGENDELRMMGGLPRANAVKYVHEKHGVNMVACVCALDRAVLPPSLDYWVPGVSVCGLHELVANALVIPGEKERETNLRGEDLPGEDE
jgi:Fe-S oxidoreductase